MENFNFKAYTEMIFGKGQISKLPEVMNRYGKNVETIRGRKCFFMKFTAVITVRWRKC